MIEVMIKRHGKVICHEICSDVQFLHRYRYQYTIANEAAIYFMNRRVSLIYSSILSTIDGIKVVIDAEKPTAILFQNALAAYHWVLCVGYKQYSVTSSYMQIVTQWSDDCERYYKIGQGSNWISSTAYYIEGRVQ